MNLMDLFWNNDRLTNSLQNSIFEYFKSRNPSVTQRNPIYRNDAKPFQVSSHAILRLNTEIDRITRSPFILGSSQTNFREMLIKLVSPQGASGEVDLKSVEMDLLKIFFEVMKNEYKESKLNLESTAFVPVYSSAVSEWEQLSTPHSVQLPFAIPEGDLILEIPIFDENFNCEKMVSISGFLPGAKILLVDDAATTRKIARQHLLSIGYKNIDECADGSAAFKKLQTGQFDLVIADWHMPNMTGLDLLKKVRSTPRMKDMPLLLATGERKQEEIMNAIKEKVSGYIVKPYDADTLFKAMKKAAAPKGAAKAAA